MVITMMYVRGRSSAITDRSVKFLLRITLLIVYLLRVNMLWHEICIVFVGLTIVVAVHTTCPQGGLAC